MDIIRVGMQKVWEAFRRRIIILDDRTKTILTAMRKILRVAQANSKALTRETGLTPSQLIFLQMLDDGHEKTAGVIAARMGITQATTTALTHKLEALGFVTRRRGETDRRQVWLTLSDKGRAVLAIAPDGVHTRFHQRFIQLKDWEQAMLIASLERVADMLGPEDLDAETLAEGVENALELPSFRIEGN
jgi:DNA-binding MarR family transcriptional regulator